MMKDNDDAGLEKRVEIIKMDWTWLTEYSVMDHLVLYHRDRKTLYSWLEVNKSGIDGTGFGLFSIRIF